MGLNIKIALTSWEEWKMTQMSELIFKQGLESDFPVLALTLIKGNFFFYSIKTSMWMWKLVTWNVETASGREASILSWLQTPWLQCRTQQKYELVFQATSLFQTCTFRAASALKFKCQIIWKSLLRRKIYYDAFSLVRLDWWQSLCVFTS